VAAEPEPLRPLIFVTVGTDHHPFERLVHWVDDWLAEDHTSAVRCLVQSGATLPPRLAEWRAFLGREQMKELMSKATAVVCHGGPGTIMACARTGIRPIVVPRRRALGEHVDDHQVAFTRMLAPKGEIELVGSWEEFRAALASALSDPAAFRRVSTLPDPAEAAERFERLIDQLMTGPTGRRRRSR
jgi:UDP-N-acetylglucosamine transferase subunit ALG13